MSPLEGRACRADWLTALPGGDWLTALLGGVFCVPHSPHGLSCLFFFGGDSVSPVFHSLSAMGVVVGHQLFDSPLLDKAREETKTAHKYAGCGSFANLLPLAGSSSL